MTDQTIRETVETALNQIEDLNTLNNSTVKKTFFDNLEKTSKHKRISLEATYSKIIQNKAKERNLNPDDFKKREKKKFSNTLGLQVTTEKKEVTEQSQQQQQQTTPSKTGLQVQNQKAMAKNPMSEEDQVKSMKAVAGGIDSFIGAFVGDMEELTETEKEDVGVCLNMMLEDYIREHGRAKILFGFMGFLGFYTNRIKKARRLKKENKEREDKATNTMTQNAESTKLSTQSEFTKKTKAYLENLKSDT